MAIARRHFPNILKASRAEIEALATGVQKGLRTGSEDQIEAARLANEPELDVIEVDNTIRNAWTAVYALQEDITMVQDLVNGAIRRGEMSSSDGHDATGRVNTAVRTIIATAPTSITGVNLVSPISGRIPFINTALELDGGFDAPEYNPTTKALTIRGALNITGAITGQSTLNITGAVTFLSTLDVTDAVTFLSTLDVTDATTLLSTLDVTELITSEGGILIDADLAEAFLVRQDGDGGDVFAVNTVTPGVTVTGTLAVSGISTLSGAVNAESTLSVTGQADFQSTVLIDVDAAEAFLVRKDGDSGDVFAINTLTSLITVTGSVTISDTLDLVNDFTISVGNATLDPSDTGNDVSGKLVSVGNNENVGAEGGAPGVIELFSADGTPCYIWCKNDGGLAIGTARPTGSTGSPTVPSEIGGIVVSTPSIKSYSFQSPPGGSGSFFVGGFYDFAEDAIDLTAATPPPPNDGVFVTFGGVNGPASGRAALVAGAVGTASGGAGTVEIVVSGTSITDLGVRTASDTEVIVADVTTMSVDAYFETTKKWIGEITFTLQNSGGSTHTAFTATFNYGLIRVEDFGGNNFNVDIFDFEGLAGSNDTEFNVQLLKHDDQNWTFAASGFLPGGTILVDMGVDYAPENDLTNATPFSFQRIDLNTLIKVVSDQEGLIIRVTTGSNNSIVEMDIHISGLFT